MGSLSCLVLCWYLLLLVVVLREVWLLAVGSRVPVAACGSLETPCSNAIIRHAHVPQYCLAGFANALLLLLCYYM